MSVLYRRTYQRAVVIPTHQVEALWRQYDQWETKLDRQLGKKVGGCVFRAMLQTMSQRSSSSIHTFAQTPANLSEGNKCAKLVQSQLHPN